MNRIANSGRQRANMAIGGALQGFAARALRVASLLHTLRAAMIVRRHLMNGIPVKVGRSPPIQEPTGARDCALQLINS